MWIWYVFYFIIIMYFNQYQCWKYWKKCKYLSIVFMEYNDKTIILFECYSVFVLFPMLFNFSAMYKVF